MNEDMNMAAEPETDKPATHDHGSLSAAARLLEAAYERWPPCPAGRRPCLLLNEGHLCIAVPWDDGYRVVAIHESDYAVNPAVIVGAIDRLFTTFDAKAAAVAETDTAEQ